MVTPVVFPPGCLRLSARPRPMGSEILVMMMGMAASARRTAWMAWGVIATVGTPQVLAAKQATASVPIVSAAMGDPVGTGLVPNLARRGGNVTGLSVQAPDLAGKRLELLREAVPGLQRLGLVGNVENPLVILELRELETAGRVLGLHVVTAELRRAEDIAPAIDALKDRADALYVAQDLLTVTNRHRINILALGARLPVMHASREN